MTHLVDRLRADADVWDSQRISVSHYTASLEREAAAEIERLTRENANLFDALKQLGADNLVLCASRSRLEAALSTLLDEQNGPPLVRRRKEWEAACQQAREALES